METSSTSLLAFLMNAAWQVALIASAAAFCDWLLRDASARSRHRLWVAALAFSFCLPALSGSQGLLSAFSGERPRQQPALDHVVAVPEASPHGFAQESALDESAPPPSPPSRRGEAAAFIPVSRKVAATLIALYLLFLCYRSLKLFGAWRRTRALRRAAYAVSFSEHLQAAIDRCQKTIGVAQARVLCSDSVVTPVTIGAFKPLILLPEHLLRESDANLLTSAIGHELIHILRRDYLLNLLYELIYLPLSFHPAARLVKRRINQTRELGCDELVTEKLLDAQSYARSLVQLAGAAIPLGRPTTNISVGVADADILEERVMTMLNSSKSTVRRQGWSLIAATLCLAAPCLAAAPFALHVQINPQGSTLALRKIPSASLRNSAPASLDAQQIEGQSRAEARLAKLKAEAEIEARRRMEREAQGPSPEATTIKLNTVDGEVSFTASQDPLVEMKRKEERRQLEARIREEKERAEREALDPEIIAHRKAEREAVARRQAELAKEAKISMQQAIQIASSQYPGTVLNSRLTRERDQACYVLSILSDNGAESATTFVIMSAIDGSILKVEKE